MPDFPLRKDASRDYTGNFMPAKKRPAPTISLARLKPLLKPVVEPVLTRLDRTERLLVEMKAALDIQFQRTAAIQAQLDRIAAGLLVRSKR